MGSMSRRRVVPAVLFLTFVAACGDEGMTTPPPVAPTAVTIGAVAPSSGTLTVPESLPYSFPGGVLLPRGSTFLNVGTTVTLDHAEPYARLSVYLLTGGTTDQVCGQNDADSPSWTALPAGWTTTYTVTGFRVYRLPCDVTGVRVVFHKRNDDHLGTIPSSGFILAESTTNVSLHIAQ